ncbi:hypothetical protein DM860_001979 [Cuscuta australis]|uniref:Protein IQ-DOMAIN 1 n=1 Tax=Cuscuta australis TaxID=267555 RepID=A0A328DYW7_9ASTE|nr:hypothetical protein DM860_001979 [Cuscuta australis]
MASREWLKRIISLRKDKERRSKTREFIGPPKIRNRISNVNPRIILCIPVEHIAAIRIQKSFRGFMARKALHWLKLVAKMKMLREGNLAKKQTSIVSSHLRAWTHLQTEIRARRVSMVVEGHLRRRKIENQSKLEEKLQSLEVEWSGGPESKEKALARIHQREEASEKRERALAYAFSHQWTRANSSNIMHKWSSLEPGKTSWAWSWTDRWIASRPWESRKGPNRPVKVKSTTKPSRLSHGSAEEQT